MSLEVETRSKRQRAEEAALKHKDLEYTARVQRIMEEVPCSESVAKKAIRKLSISTKEEKGKKPSIKVKKGEEKEAPFIPSKEEAQAEELQPAAERPIEELEPADEAQLDYFRDMLRGIHILIFAEGGVVELLVKAGRPEEQVKQVSDQLYRWLLRRYKPEDLERWDTLLLVASYGTLIGGIIKDAVQQRAKTEQKKEDKKKEEKKP